MAPTYSFYLAVSAALVLRQRGTSNVSVPGALLPRSQGWSSMEDSGEHADKSLPLSKVVCIDRICDQFDWAILDAIRNRGAWPNSED
jgi:hypothetical protein